MNKIEVISAFLLELKGKRQALVEELSSLREGLMSDSKNTSGDKHETSRAMNQIEQERIGKLLSQVDEQIEQLKSIHPKPTELVNTGSLLSLNGQWFFIASGMGKKMIGEKNVFSLSLQSPLGEILKGKRLGDRVSFNGSMQVIEELL
jgi:transcription elongation GreA/GreB family factor